MIKAAVHDQVLVKEYEMAEKFPTALRRGNLLSRD